MRFRSRLIFLAMVLSLSLAGARAEEVSMQHNGLALNAEYQRADSASLPDEPVILITHGGLGHRGMETIAYLQKLFVEQGFHTLAINLSLGVDERTGMYDCKHTHRHLYADAADEIDAWVGWLKSQGATRVVVLGHSRGAAETALYAAEHEDPLVKAVVLLAPDTRETNDGVAYERRHNKALAPILQSATELTKAGQGDTVLEHTDFLYCTDTRVTAATFVSYYGADPRLDTGYLIPKIDKPTLVVTAGDDEVVINNEKFPPLADGVKVKLQVVEGSGHFLRDLYADEAAEIVAAYLRELHL